ncbi:hypothetical protein PMAYCL1PPCAC_01497, partial [Pristionchus mayeri]
EEWKRKTYDFSNKSSDDLTSVFARTFEGMSIILKEFEPCRIQRVLASIDLERKNCLRFEKSDEPSIRSLMFGIIESLHLTLTHLTEGKGHVSKDVVSVIEEWKKQSLEFANQSFDGLVPVISKGFDSMFIIVKNAEICHIRRALRVLHFERSLSFHHDNIEEFSIRSLMYGMMESIHLILQQLTEKSDKSSKSSEEVSTEKNHLPISIYPINSSDLDSTHSVDQVSTIPTFTTNFQSTPKKEPIDLTQLVQGEKE